MTFEPLSYRQQRGVSLLETCVVLAIVLIVTSAVAPPLTAFLDRQRLEGAAAELAADLQYVRSEAVARNQPLRLSVYSLAGGSCYVIHSGARADCVCEASGPALCSGDALLLKTVQWPAGDPVAMSANVGSMLFDPVQGTTTPTGTFRISDSHERTISHVVNIVGRVRSCTAQGSVPGYRAC